MGQEFGEVSEKCLIYHKIACSVNVKKTKIEFGDGHCVLKCQCLPGPAEWQKAC